MNVEHDIKVIPINADHEAAVKKLVSEGWELMPGVPPIGIYHVVRVRPGAAPVQDFGSIAQLKIDDSKVWIVKPGDTQQ